jgi:uncharacterized protein
VAAPLRTCVGCRATGPIGQLLRVVVAGSGVVVDRHHRLPGRGAHLHPDPACLALAERRHAFSRALRVEGPLDLAPVRDALGQVDGPGGVPPVD